jgi:outer membrane immunogenic protein
LELEDVMRILAGTLSLALGATISSAMAADLPARMPVKAPVAVAEVYNWNGFYIGGNGGYSWGRSRTDANFFNSATGAAIAPPVGSVTAGDFNLRGGVAGGQAGWNWQTGSFLFGLETDFQWSGEKGSTAFLCAATGAGGPCLPGATFLPTSAGAGTAVSISQQIEWFGTFRARAGMLFAPSVLGYVTGGLAYGSVKTDLGLTSTIANTLAGTPVAAAASASTTHAGWVIGAGIEAMFAQNWSGKLEYLYMDLGTYSNTVALAAPPIGVQVNSRITDNIFRAGINYHFSAGPVVARY